MRPDSSDGSWIEMNNAEDRNDQSDGSVVSGPTAPGLEPSPCKSAVLFWATGTVALAVVCVVAAFGVFTLPEPVDSSADPTVFSEARAREHLAGLVAIGCRRVGTPQNELVTPEYILQRIAGLPTHPNVEVEVEVQRSGSGAVYHLKGVYSYSNVTNVVLRLSSRSRRSGDPKENALLIGGHFDSGFLSPGAGDDGTSVAVMLEMAANLIADGLAGTAADSATQQPAAILFVFNGAEEVGLLGAHAFITQHPWASSARAFINMEAGGTGGKSLLCRIGPKNEWLARAAARSMPYPYATVIAQDVHNTGVVTSNTDWVLYGPLGGMPGLDYAYMHNGYVYHTPLDQVKYIDPGSLQHEGANVLAVTREILRGGLLTAPDRSNASAVMYDILGLIAVEYTVDAAVALHSVIVVLNVCLLVCFLLALRRFASVAPSSVAVRRGVALLALSVAVVVCSWVLCLALPVSLAFLMGRINPLAWYTQIYVGVVFYSLFALVGALLPHAVLRVVVRRKFPGCTNAMLEQYTFWTGQLFFLVLLIIGTAKGIGGSYLLMWFVVVPPAVNCLVFAASLLHRARHAGRFKVLESSANAARTIWPSFVLKGQIGMRWWIVAAAVGLPWPTLLLMQTFIVIWDAMLPMTGRMPTPGDLVFAVFSGLPVMLLSTYVVPFTHRVGHLFKAVLTVAGCGLVLFVAACFVVPFTADTPARLNIIHDYWPETNESYVNLTFWMTPPYLKVLDHFDRDAIKRNGTAWIVASDVAPPQVPVPSVELRGISTRGVAFDVSTYNATDFLLTINTAVDITTLTVDGAPLSSIPRQPDGSYTARHVIGLQNWTGFTVTPVELEWSAVPGFSADFTIQAWYELSTPALGAVVSRLPDWTTRFGHFQTRVSLRRQWTVATSS